jgi:glycosyltransferase involved in cell wall biosynthesis
MAWANRLRSRLLACFTDEMVAVSGATAEVMAKAMWLPGKRIRVIANGIDAGRHSEFRIQNPDSRRSQESEGNSPETGQPNNQKLLEGSPIRVKLGISEDTLVMGSVGRLAHVKGYDRLIGVFAALAPESKVSPCLLLIGDGPERASLERQAQDLGVADRVIFAGYQADPGPYLMAMDVFVLPSRSEGLSVSLLEAMAAGVPVAVTDVGANREVIEGGRCGTLLPGDDRMWAGVFEDVSANSDSVQAKADLALHRVREHYSIEATLEGYERLYARSPVL